MAGRSAVWGTSLAVLGALILAGSAYPLTRTFAHFEINYNEGWNVYRQSMAAHRIPLFGAPPKYSVTNYPPVSFHIVGFVGSLIGDYNAAGRYISLLSLATIAGFVALIAREFAPPPAAAYAALTFLAWIAALAPGRIGMNDPQLFATVFSVAAAYIYLKTRSAPWLCASAILFVLALFSKHNLLALPAAAFVHLAFTRSWKRLAIWCGTFAASAGVLLWLTLRIDGSYFFAHLMAPRTVSTEAAVLKIVFYAICCGIAMAGAAVWCRRNAFKPGRNFLVIAFIVANLLAFAFAGGAGVDANIFFDGMIVLAVILAVAVADMERSGCAGAPLLANALVPFTTAAVLIVHGTFADVRAFSETPRLEREFRETAAFIDARPGPAFCGDPLVCFASHKPEGISMFYVSEQIKLGKLPEREISNQIESHQFSTIEIPVVSTIEYGEGILAAIRNSYRIGLQNTKYTVFVPARE